MNMGPALHRATVQRSKITPFTRPRVTMTFALKGKQMAKVSLHAERGDVEDGGVRAAFAHKLKEFAQLVAEVPRSVPPDPVQVEGHAEENQQVWECHATEVKVGGGSHVFVFGDHQDGQQVPSNSDEEQERARHCDASQDRDWEEIDGVLKVLSSCINIHNVLGA